MPNKRTNNEKITVRIKPSIVSEARRIARRDYGDESRISPVVEEALTKYVASEKDEGAREAMLSATEGAIYDRISRKIEKEIDNFTDRAGNLVAAQSYEATLATLILEEWFFRQHGNTKEKYEDLRSTAQRRLKTRFRKNGADDQLIALADQVKSLQEALEKARGALIKSEEERKRAAAELKRQLEDEQSRNRQMKAYYEGLISHIASNQSSILGKTTLTKPLEQLIAEYEGR
jgi:hypothetical protein